MPYDLKLAQINTNLGGLKRANTAWGFPANTNFHTLLMSYWACGPVHILPGTSGNAGIWPEFKPAAFFSFDPGFSNGISFTNQVIGSAGNFFKGTFTSPFAAGCLSHYLLSVDTHAQSVQLYINDQLVPLTGVTWTGTPPFDFNVAASVNIWAWDVSGVIFSSRYPALADVWISNTPTFVDLSVTANRRKFINANFTAVDLGDTGTNPFGYQPAMYMSVRPGGVATDILLNRGVSGGTWGYDQNPPTTQAPGSCSLPPPTLAMDDVVCTAEPGLSSNLISLSYSDDRGHSWSNPISQPFGAAGEYNRSLLWNRLGYTRDRIFSLSWSVPCATALQGAWINAEPGDGKG